MTPCALAARFLHVPNQLSNTLAVFGMLDARFGDIDNRGVTPQGFQTIKITRFGLEHIHYELTVIEKLPRMIVGLLAGNGLYISGI